MALLSFTISVASFPVPRFAVWALGPLIAVVATVLREIGLIVPSTLASSFLVLILPGYLTILALRGRLWLTTPEKLLLSIAISVSITILLGLLLHFTPWGLTPHSWAFALGLFCLSAGLLIPKGGRETLEIRVPHFPLGDVLICLAAFSLLLTAFLIARVSFDTQPRPGFSELWITTEAGPEEAWIQLNLRSEENEPATYEVRVLVDEVEVHRWESIDLENGATWRGRLLIDALPPFAELVAESRLLGEPDTIQRRVTSQDPR